MIIGYIAFEDRFSELNNQRDGSGEKDNGREVSRNLGNLIKSRGSSFEVPGCFKPCQRE